MSVLLSTADSKSPTMLMLLYINASFNTLDHLPSWLSLQTFWCQCPQLSVLIFLRSTIVGCCERLPISDGQAVRLCTTEICIQTSSVFDINNTCWKPDYQLQNIIPSFCRWHCYSCLNKSHCTVPVQMLSLTKWHIRNDLLIHTVKTDVLIMGTQKQIVKFDQSHDIFVFEVIVSFIHKLCVLGVTLNSYNSLNDRITGVVHSYNYHIRALYQMHPLISQMKANCVACSILRTRLDFFISIFYDVAKSHINHLQYMQNLPALWQKKTKTVWLHSDHTWLMWSIAMLTFRVWLQWLPVFRCES